MVSFVRFGFRLRGRVSVIYRAQLALESKPPIASSQAGSLSQTPKRRTPTTYKKETDERKAFE